MTNTGSLKLCVPCPLDDVRVIDGIQDLLRQFLSASQIHDFDILIVKCVSKKEDMKIPLYIFIYTAFRQVHITV